MEFFVYLGAENISVVQNRETKKRRRLIQLINIRLLFDVQKWPQDIALLCNWKYIRINAPQMYVNKKCSYWEWLRSAIWHFTAG